MVICQRLLILGSQQSQHVARPRRVLRDKMKETLTCATWRAKPGGNLVAIFHGEVKKNGVFATSYEILSETLAVCL